jgi:hypothetical protein
MIFHQSNTKIGFKLRSYNNLVEIASAVWAASFISMFLRNCRIQSERGRSVRVKQFHVHSMVGAQDAAFQSFGTCIEDRQCGDVKEVCRNIQAFCRR